MTHFSLHAIAALLQVFFSPFNIIFLKLVLKQCDLSELPAVVIVELALIGNR